MLAVVQNSRALGRELAECSRASKRTLDAPDRLDPTDLAEGFLSFLEMRNLVEVEV